MPRNGLIVSNARAEPLERVLVRECWTPVERFDTRDGWAAEGAGNAFAVLHRGEQVGRVEWKLQGAHNRANALAAIAAARHAGVPPRVATEALSRFESVRRRMEIRGVVREITVYDDFAHHPTAIETTLAGLRANVDGDRIIAVIEPRSNTMKLGVMKQALPGSLAAADLVFCYSAGLTWDAAEALKPLGAKARVHSSLDVLVDEIVRASRPGDHLLVMSNGGFGGIHDKLLNALGATP